MKEDQNSERYVVRSVVRALDLLVAVAEAGDPVGLAALAEQTGLNPSTAYRLLESLASRNFVRQAPGAGYVLASRAVDVGAAFLRRVSVWEASRDLADALAERTGETASVGILDEGQVLYIAIAQAQRELGIQSQAGARHPVHCTALGKALLAELDWEQAQEVLLARGMPRRTDSTLTTLPEMRAELQRVREDGYAVDHEERVPDVVCLAAVLHDESGGPVGAVSVSGPAFRVREHLPALADAVVAAARSGSRRLGAVPA